VSSLKFAIKTLFFLNLIKLHLDNSL